MSNTFETEKTIEYTSSEMHFIILPEYSAQERKEIRKERYESSIDGLNVNLFNDLKSYKLLYNSKNNGNGSNTSLNNFNWDMQGLNEIPFSKDISRENMLQILNPKEDITYIEVENLLSVNPNTLVATMTLLTNNYQWCVEEFVDKVRVRYDISRFKYSNYPRFLFSNAEEKIFLTGRTLLVELNKVYNSGYLEELIRDTDGVISNFNTGLVGKVANRYKDGRDLEELFQEGHDGLLTALKKFDIDLNWKFSSYAFYWIRQRIVRFIANNESLIKEPIALRHDINRFIATRAILEQELGQPPSIGDTIKYCEENNIKLPFNRKNIDKALRQRIVLTLDPYHEITRDSSLFELIPGERITPEDLLLVYYCKEKSEEIFEMAKLNKTEEKIVKLSLGIIPNERKDRATHTIKEIQEITKIPKTKVSMIQKSAIKKLERLGKR